MEITEKLPCCLESERMVLGSIILWNECLETARDWLTPSSFFLRQNQVLFSAMIEMAEEGTAIDYVTLSEHLQRTERLATVGADYLYALGDGVPRIGNQETHCHIVRDKEILRRIVHATETIRQLGFDQDSQAVDKSVEIISAIAAEYRSQRTAISRQGASVQALAALDRPAVRVSTGIPKLDDHLGGLGPGELCVATAYTGTGKTYFALQVADEACKVGLHSLYASGEMFAAHLMGRVLSGETGISYTAIRRCKLSGEELRELAQAASRQCKHCGILDGDVTLPAILRESRRMAKADGIGLLVVDYDELIEVSGKDEWEQQRRLVRSLKSLAIELKIPVLLISQLRKSFSKDESPTLERLYGSGTKSKHPNIVLYIDRPFVQNLQGSETEAEIQVLKNRDGTLGAVKCRFDLVTHRFEQVIC
jgi:replicative DNA helicase